MPKVALVLACSGSLAAVGVAAPSAAADVTCNSTGCVASVAAGPAGAAVSIGGGQATGGVVVLTPAVGVVGPGVIAVGGTAGQPTTATQVAVTPVGQFGRVGDVVSVSIGNSGLAVGADAFQFTPGNGIVAGGAASSGDPTTTGEAGSCQLSGFGANCTFVQVSIGPAGTTAGGQFAGPSVLPQHVACFAVSLPPGGPLTVSNCPLPV